MYLNIVLENCGIEFFRVEIKSIIPKASTDSKDFKIQKIFVGDIPTTMTEGCADSNHEVQNSTSIDPIYEITPDMLL